MLIKHNRASRLIIESILIGPGISDIPQDVWLKMRTHSTIKTLLAEGILEEVTDADDLVEGAPEHDPVDELIAMKVNEAGKAVEQVMDLNLLAKWEARETRRPVILKLRKQIALITAPPEERDRSEIGAMHVPGVDIVVEELRPDYSGS